MIVDTIVGFITSVLSVIFDALPSWSIISALGLPDAGSHDSNSLGHVAGSYVGGFDGIFPIHEITDLLLLAFTALLSAYAIYKVANWVWRHVPELWGFGPGSG